MSSSLLQRGPRMPALSLAQRLAAGFGAMVILLVAVTAVSMWELRTMGAHLGRIVDENNPKSELANRLLNDLYEMSIQARSIALLTDAADIEGEVRRMEASRARYAHTEKALQARIGASNASPEERQLIEDIVAQGRKVLPLLRQAAQEGQDGANIQATETLTKVVRPLETVWQAKVAQLVLLEAARNRQADEAARAGLSHAMAVAMAMVGVAALVGALLGWRIVRRVKRPIDQAIVIAERIAAGDLSSPVEVESNDEIGRLVQAIGCMQDRLRELVTEIRQSAESIQTASAEVSAGSLDLQQRTEATASNLRSTAGSMDKLTGAVRLTAESAVTANDLATTATTVAQRGGEAVSQVVSKMADMTANSRRIADIVGVIDLIAFQTNVLALNAAVEAAQAGDAGRGFAVVAGEVRALAKRSADAAKEIKGLIDASVNGIATVSNLVQHAGGTMADIVVSAGRVTEVVAEISTASSEQSRSMAQLSVAAATLDEMTQHNAALVEQSTASAEMLRDQAVRLMALVMSFKVRRDDVDAIVP